PRRGGRGRGGDRVRTRAPRRRGAADRRGALRLRPRPRPLRKRLRGGALRILVSGMVAGDPHQGGATWAVLQYVLGLRALGHDVLLVEPVAARRDPRTDRYFGAVVQRFGLNDRAALLVRDSTRTVGLPYDRVRGFARGADVVLNVAGMLRDEALLDAIGVRVFLDLDPAFNQLWHAVDGVDMGLDRHNRFATA